MAAILFVVLGGRKLMSMRMDADGELVAAGAGGGSAAVGGGARPDRSDARSATGATPTTGTAQPGGQRQPRPSSTC